MTRHILAVLLAGGVFLTGWAFAQEPPADKDEPPLRLKKKVSPDEPEPSKEPKKPAAEEKKPDEPGKEPEPAEPEENDKEVLDRVAKNMRSLEERLANKELGEGTRQVGDDILKDLESLIRMSENPPQGGGGEDSQNNPAGASNDPKNPGGKSSQRSPSGGRKRGDKSSQQGNGGNGTGSQPSGSSRKPGGGGKQPGDQPTGGGQKPGTDPMGKGGKDDKTDPLNPNADLYKDIWGHLPEALRAEMNAYSSDKEMIPKYDALIKKCSRTIAEQGSRKDK